VDQYSKKKSAPQDVPASERRRIGMVVHDDRGNASVSWQDAPSDYERPVLEVLGNPGLSIKHDEAFDPYARRTARKPGGGANSVTTRTDLRRLSEWIKMMRELEARKREGGGED
jgi:hypothetical protein